MFKAITSAVAVSLALCSPGAALTVTSGEVIRGAYLFPTFGSNILRPTSFLLRLTPSDLFGAGDAVGIRYLDAAVTPVSFSTFNSTGASLDPTVGITFEIGDLLPPAMATLISDTGFVEIVGLAGSFDVLSLSLFATEGGPGGALRTTDVSDFTRIAKAPSPVPLPPSRAFLLLAIIGLLGKRTRNFGRALRA